MEVIFACILPSYVLSLSGSYRQIDDVMFLAVNLSITKETHHFKVHQVHTKINLKFSQQINIIFPITIFIFLSALIQLLYCIFGNGWC